MNALCVFTFFIAALRYVDEYGPSNPKFGGDPRSGSASMRPEISGGHYSDLYREPQVVWAVVILF